MAIHGVNPKCYILALFVRDDGTRFLLGDDPFEFKDKQLHFQPNTMANDVVEVQGNDGYLLAGQVRRPGTQMFDGYVANGTNSKADVEVKRREFLQFFRRSHFYKVIYVFPNGTAIQRKQGFLVDDPTVQELYQQYPEYHVALNFEDVNYYTYEEDDQGHEIYAKEAIVPLAGGGATGGLIWDNYGVVWEDPWSLPLSISGVQFQILNDNNARAPIENVELLGDTYQQTYSGWQMLGKDGYATPISDTSYWRNVSSEYTQTILGNGWARFYNGTSSAINYGNLWVYTGSQFEASTTYTIIFEIQNLDNKGNNSYLVYAQSNSTLDSIDSATVAYTQSGVTARTDGCGWDKITDGQYVGVFTTKSELKETLPRMWFRYVQPGATFDLRVSIIKGNHSSDWRNYAGDNWQPYVGGGIPAPNPDYPQDVQTVTGRQVVTVSDGGSQSQEHEVNLGKNLFDYSYMSMALHAFNATTGAITGSSTNRLVSENLLKLDKGTYTLSFDTVNSCWIMAYDLSGNYLGREYIQNAWDDTNNKTFVLDQDAQIRVCLRYSDNSTVAVQDYNIQVEKGSAATSYALYFTPIELCKIGDYQDYIYKSGDDWYVHKESSKIELSTISTWGGNNGSFFKSGFTNAYGIKIGELLSNIFIYDTTTWAGIGKCGITSTGNFWCMVDSSIANETSLRSLFSDKAAFLYGILTTPTDTKITDATLVGQLDTLGTMRLYIGGNNVLVASAGSNLPATLSFDYYTKFVAIGAEWEEGGTKGATIVDVDAIDNTYPVWELTGPATNPTLSVLTTNTALTYNGTITASQKLVIDMFNKTATLNGTSVIGNISGDFVYMAPGTNRVAYTAGNTDAPDSTIYWQEVVG